MNRRDLLCAIGTAACGCLAGCSGIAGTPDEDGTNPDQASITQSSTLTWQGINASAGGSVGLAQDRRMAIVGAYGTNETDGETGSAFIFTPNDGTWESETTLAPADEDAWVGFGRFVTVSDNGKTVLVGAPNDNMNGPNVGSVYGFRQSDTGWHDVAKIVPTNGDSHDRFGISGALSADGTTAVVGAVGDENRAGSAYVFERTESVWRQQTRLNPADGDKDDLFGSSVEISGDGTTAIVGASGDEDPNGRQSGSAYVFDLTAEAMVPQQKLVPQDGQKFARFGTGVSLSMDGTRALVGSPRATQGGTATGTASIFSKTSNGWKETGKLFPTGEDSPDEFGDAVALSSDGETAVIGAPNDRSTDGNRLGSAFLFSRESGQWSKQSKLVTDEKKDNDHFGVSVSLSENTILVGASGATSAYLFHDPRVL